MNVIFNTAHLTGLFLFLGGALFRRLIWNAVCANASKSLVLCVKTRSDWLMIAGMVLFVAATLAEALYSGWQSGLIGILLALLAPIFIACFLAGERRNSGVFQFLATMVGLMIIASLATASHAATESGILPIASSIAHWVSVVAWGGCLLNLSLLPWSALYREYEQGGLYIGKIANRYAIVTLFVLGLFVLTGGLLAFIHVHNADAMSSTQYGNALSLKGAMVAALLITLSVNLLKIGPACEQPALEKEPQGLRVPLRRFRVVVIIETILLAGLIVSSAILVTRDPPGVAPFLNPQSWHMTMGEVPLTLQLQPVAGSASRVRIEISAASPDYRFPDGTRAAFDIYTSNHDADMRDIEALPIGPSGFLGEVVLAIPGEWHFHLTLAYPNGNALAGDYILVLPAQPLEEDLKAYLSLSAIQFSPANAITFVVGALLLLIAGWLLRQSQYGKGPIWLMPASMANMVLGAYLALSVVFVKTYPTTFWINPQPYTAAVIRQGDIIYRAHCMECHGAAGRGDGPWAIAERGSIPDLTAPHMDRHTDGEVYWWITRGIPSLDMPALGEEISEKERWAAINHMRSLRHGVPALRMIENDSRQ